MHMKSHYALLRWVCVLVGASTTAIWISGEPVEGGKGSSNESIGGLQLRGVLDLTFWR